MRRLRLALLLLGVALAVPVMLLVARAREGERLEREMRHQAVAARAFDEMERELTAVLESEESRPFAAYRALVAGEPEAMAEVPEFVIGHFQLDPDGSLHARPGTDVGAIARETLAVGFEVSRRSAPPATTLLRSEEDAFDLALARPRAATEAPAMGDETAKSARPPDDAYDVISRLNLGRTSRAERKQQVRQEPLGTLYGSGADSSYDVLLEGAPESEATGELEEQTAEFARNEPTAGAPREEPTADAAPDEQVAGAALDEQVAGATSDESTASGARAAQKLVITRKKAAMPAAAPPAPSRADEREMFDAEGLPHWNRPAEELPTPGIRSSAALLDRSRLQQAAELRERQGADKDEAGRVRVALDPMVGRPVAGDRLLLYRTALVDDLGYRQGVLLDRRALAAWLEGRVLARQGLGGLAELRFDQQAQQTRWAPRGHMVFGHRFAEPFDAMAGQLALAPLPTRSGTSAFSIYALAGLLALVAAGGLLAVDRMVKVVVSFAERRSRFVASVSHELKTPLTAIRMYAEMLRDGLVRDEAKRDEYYDTITDESERLSRLIDNVLAFSKLERGQREIELAVGAVPDVLEEAAGKLRPHAERQGFALRVAAEPGLPPVRFDRDALLQVLFNLVDNAMKYARPASPAEVVLEARAEGDRVLVGVRDYGPGVDRRDLARIFEPFYRVEAELTRSAKGTGIGLALVKELGQAMGAAVSGANAEGGGFRVMLAFEPSRT